jgi:hypothetical protein
LLALWKGKEMIRKLLCKLKAHEPEFQVVRCNVDGPEGLLTYDKQTDQFIVYIAINLWCKHCKKPLGSRIIHITYSAKELLNLPSQFEAKEIIRDLAYGHQSRRIYNELIRRAREII